MSDGFTSEQYFDVTGAGDKKERKGSKVGHFWTCKITLGMHDCLIAVWNWLISSFTGSDRLFTEQSSFLSQS